MCCKTTWYDTHSKQRRHTHTRGFAHHQACSCVTLSSWLQVPVARCVYAVLARPDSEPHKPLAQQLFDLAQERSSPAGRFLKVYGAIRSEKEAQRVERKRIRKMEAVLDPALAAQRRIKATKAKRYAF